MSVSMSISDAKANFSAAIRRAESGEAVFITRYGKRVADLFGTDAVSEVLRSEPLVFGVVRGVSRAARPTAPRRGGFRPASR